MAKIFFRWLFLIGVIIFFGIILITTKEPKCYNYGRVLDVEPYHATRVSVTYISTCGDTINTTEHCSTTVKADNISFDVSDYLNGKLKYGKIK